MTAYAVHKQTNFIYLQLTSITVNYLSEIIQSS